MSLVTLLDTITLSVAVRDRHASAEWYEAKLGFKLNYHMDDAGWSEMQTATGGVTLGLGDHMAPSPGSVVPVFGVADIKTARQALEGAGVRFEGETETVDGMVSTATFYDPDGNALTLAQDLSGTA